MSLGPAFKGPLPNFCLRIWLYRGSKDPIRHEVHAKICDFEHSHFVKWPKREFFGKMENFESYHWISISKPFYTVSSWKLAWILFISIKISYKILIKKYWKFLPQQPLKVAKFENWIFQNTQLWVFLDAAVIDESLWNFVCW